MKTKNTLFVTQCSYTVLSWLRDSLETFLLHLANLLGILPTVLFTTSDYYLFNDYYLNYFVFIFIQYLRNKRPKIYAKCACAFAHTRVCVSACAYAYLRICVCVYMHMGTNNASKWHNFAQEQGLLLAQLTVIIFIGNLLIY